MFRVCGDIGNNVVQEFLNILTSAKASASVSRRFVPSRESDSHKYTSDVGYCCGTSLETVQRSTFNFTPCNCGPKRQEQEQHIRYRDEWNNKASERADDYVIKLNLDQQIPPKSPRTKFASHSLLATES